MNGIRHEKYRNISSELPLSLGVDIERKHIEAIKEYGLIEGYRKTYAPIKDMIKEV